MAATRLLTPSGGPCEEADWSAVSCAGAVGSVAGWKYGLSILAGGVEVAGAEAAVEEVVACSPFDESLFLRTRLLTKLLILSLRDDISARRERETLKSNKHMQ